MPQRADTRAQTFLLPPSLDEWTHPEHPVRFVAAFVDALTPEEWDALGVVRRPERLGAPRYAPRALLSAWIYGFMRGIRSARALERACIEQLPLRWLTNNQCPDHNTLWRFYRTHREHMRVLLQRTIQTAVRADLVDLALLAVDGTKVRANAAADRSLDGAALAALLERTEAAIAEMEAQNERGEETPPPSLPPELRTAKALEQRVRAAMAECAERGAAVGKAKSVGPPRGNVTDPEARWMKIEKGISPGYNAQAAVVATNGTARAVLGADAPGGRIVVAAIVTTQPTDYEQLVPMITAATQAIGTAPTLTVAAPRGYPGYHSGETLAAAEAAGYPVALPESSVVDPALAPYHRASFVYDAELDTLTCPKGQELTYRSTNSSGRRYQGSAEVCRACEAFGVCTTSAANGRIVSLTEHAEVVQAHREVQQQSDRLQAMERRKHLIEPVFGIAKQVLHARQWLLRGRANVEAEWVLLATALNTRTLARIWTAMAPPERARLLALSSGT